MAGELRMAQKLEAVGRLAAGVAHEINTPIQYIGDSLHFLESALSDFQKVLGAYRAGVARIAAGAIAQQVKEQLDAAERSGDIEFHAIEVPKAFARTLDGVARVAQIVRAMKEFSHPHRRRAKSRGSQSRVGNDADRRKERIQICGADRNGFSRAAECRVQRWGAQSSVFESHRQRPHAIAQSGKDASQGKISIATRLVDSNAKSCSPTTAAASRGRICRRFSIRSSPPRKSARAPAKDWRSRRSIVIDKHRGSVRVKSKVGTGTKFILRLPVADDPPPGTSCVMKHFALSHAAEGLRTIESAQPASGDRQ